MIPINRRAGNLDGLGILTHNDRGTPVSTIVKFCVVNVSNTRINVADTISFAVLTDCDMLMTKRRLEQSDVSVRGHTILQEIFFSTRGKSEGAIGARKRPLSR